MHCRIRLMAKKDLPQITSIDREAFPTMWPPVNFQHELSNRLAHYIVACDGSRQAVNPEPPPSLKLVPVRSFMGLKWPFGAKAAKMEITPEKADYISGFVGLWLMVDEAHIINLAVREACRGTGVGELLLISGIEMAIKLKASVATLEVRASNRVAQNLYTKYGFSQVGIRKGYYTDNKEDAFIMTTGLLSLEAVRQRFYKLKEAHFQKLGQVEFQIDS